MNKKQFSKFLNEICGDYCEEGKYCLLKFFLSEAHNSHRMLMQLKCIERFKFEKNKSEDEDIGWQHATEMWVEDGYAKIFSEYYNEDKTYRQIYKEVMKHEA